MNGLDLSSSLLLLLIEDPKAKIIWIMHIIEPPTNPFPPHPPPPRPPSLPIPHRLLFRPHAPAPAPAPDGGRGTARRRAPGGRAGGMRAPQERTMGDLYDRTRTRHKDLALPEEPVEGFPGGGRAECSGQREVAPKMEDKPTVRKKLVPSDSPRVKAESGTCNVCCAPCSSCLHQNLVLADSNMYCGSSQTCCTRSETKNSSFVHSEKGLHTKGGENDDEFSATSSHASYSENGGNKAMARSYIGADSEVDMPAKRRKLLNHDARSLRVECQDDSNSCVTGVSAAGKLLLDKKKDKLSTSASNRDLTVKGYKDNNVASHNRLKNYCVEDSTEKKRSDVHVMHPSSSDRSVPADSPSVTKKLLRTQSSVSASQGLSHKRPTHGFGNSGDNLAHQPYEKASLSNNNIQHSPGGKLYPAVIGGDKHGCWGLRSRCWGRELNQMDLLFCIPVRIYNIYNIYI